MEIKMNLPDDPKIIDLINQEMTEENEELRKKLVELEGKIQEHKKREKIKIRLKPKKQKNFVEARLGKGRIKISKKTKQSNIKTGYLNKQKEANIGNIDKMVEEKVNKILNKKSKIRLNVKPRPIVKNIMLDIPEEELPSAHEEPEEKEDLDFELSDHKPLEEEDLFKDGRKEKQKSIRLLVNNSKPGEKKKPAPEGEEEKTIMIKTSHGRIPVKIKKREKEEFVKTGCFGPSPGGGGSDLAALIPLIKEMMGKDEEKPPKIKGIKIPEV